VRDTIAQMSVPSVLDFFREIFVTVGHMPRVESRCGRCGFRIAADTVTAFALFEQRHSDTCRGAVAD
jgi:hypothetical protein